jgi:outer membrane receptor protein involved in Fe transport
VATQARFINSIAPSLIPADALAVIGDFTAPQENTQYEIGWKKQGERWNVTLAAFSIDWKNQPFAAVIQLPTAGTTSIRGAGDSRYRGFDFEGNFQATNWLLLSGQIGYVDAEMVSFSSRGSEEQVVLRSGSLSVVADGNPPRSVPELTGSFSPTIQGSFAGRRWSLRTDVIYTDSMYGDYSKLNLIPGNTRVNLRLSAELTKSVQMEFFGTNIFDELAFPTNASTLAGPTRGTQSDRKIFTGLPQRRNFGIRINASF